MNTPVLLKIVLHGKITPTQNEWQRMHWADRARTKKDWQRWIVCEARVQAPRLVRAGVETCRTVHVVRYSVGTPDIDNLVSPAGKLILDPMRARVKKKVGRKMQWVDGPLGFIYDDDPEHVTFTVTACRVEHLNQQKTIIIVGDA